MSSISSRSVSSPPGSQKTEPSRQNWSMAARRRAVVFTENIMGLRVSKVGMLWGLVRFAPVGLAYDLVLLSDLKE